MIKNPWPMKWVPITVKDHLELRHFICRYSGRFTLFCGQTPNGLGGKQADICKNCYMRQMSMTNHQVIREKAVIERVCDRCGTPIPNPDTVIYIDIMNHIGGNLLSAELCRGCSQELTDWLSGGAFVMPPPTVDAEGQAEILLAYDLAQEEEAKKLYRKKKEQREKRRLYYRHYFRKRRAQQREEKRKERDARYAQLARDSIKPNTAEDDDAQAQAREREEE